MVRLEGTGEDGCQCVASNIVLFVEGRGVEQVLENLDVMEHPKTKGEIHQRRKDEDADGCFTQFFIQHGGLAIEIGH